MNPKAFIAASFIAVLPISIAYAASVTARLQIQATILPTLEYRVIETRSLKISKSDVKNGFKEVDNGCILSISTNSTNGYVLSLYAEPVYAVDKFKDKGGREDKNGREHESESSLYTSVTVKIDGNTYTVPSGGSVDVFMPYEGLGKMTKRLSYRFNLTPQAHEGKFPLPITITSFLM